MKYELLRMKVKDAKKVERFLANTPAKLPDSATLKDVIRKGFGIICRDRLSRKYKGVVLTYITRKRNVIAFFYLAPEIRMKPVVRDLFSSVVKNFNKELPIHLYSTDISTFKNQVKPLNEEGMYEWVGDLSLWEQ